jgi:hypothetical protein
MLSRFPRDVRERLDVIEKMARDRGVAADLKAFTEARIRAAER